MKKSIKAIAAIVVAAISLSLAGCTKDNEDLIIGTWNVTSLTETISGHPDASMNGTHTESVPAGFTMTFVFNKDNTGKMLESGYGESEESPFTYIVRDDKLDLTVREEGSSLAFTVTFDIEKLDKKEMIISMTENENDEYEDENGEWHEVTYTEKMVYNMTKA